MSTTSSVLPYSEEPIVVNVSDPVMKEGGKYIVYTISGSDRDGPFEVFRRYSDFDHYRTFLLSRWTGCYIPPIPAKKTIGNKETKFLEDRKRFLQFFVEKISEAQYIWYSDENREFIRNSSSDFEKTLNQIPRQTTEDIINKYKTIFSYLAGKEINNDLNSKITTFKGFLEKGAKNLEKIKGFCRNLAATKERSDIQFSQTCNVILPEYEKNCLVEYTQGNENAQVFMKDETLKANLQDLSQLNKTNDFETLVNMIRMELKEVESFQEALKQKDILEEKKFSMMSKLRSEQSEQLKLQAGKTTFKSLFQKGTKEDLASKLDRQISDTQKELDNLTLLSDLVTVIIGYVEIDKFKNEKQYRYYNIMQVVSSTQYTMNSRYTHLWQAVKTANQNLSESNFEEKSYQHEQN